jgi:hypothetical protein
MGCVAVIICFSREMFEASSIYKRIFDLTDKVRIVKLPSSSPYVPL